VVLATWAAGVAGAVAVVVQWRVVGAGFVWLGAGVTMLLGFPAALGDHSVWPWVGCSLVAACFVASRRWALVVGLMWAAAACFIVAAWSGGSFAAPLTGAILLGGVTGEMMLGHWYLVDPRLPRRALRALDLGGGAGAVLEFCVLAFSGAIPWVAADGLLGVAFVVLSATTAALMAAVWFALGEKGYAGVMAATGLSYLAVLTAIGAAVAGRILLG